MNELASSSGIITPSGQRGPGVLVIHSWWGLTGAIRRYGQSLADEGFVVCLADLFGGECARNEAEARRLRGRRRKEPAYTLLLRRIEDLRAECDRRDSGIVGFSMGGHWAVWLAQNAGSRIAATCLYYAARGGDFSLSKSAFIAHFADDDAWVSGSARRSMERAIAAVGCPYTGFDYPGTGHWFAEFGRPEYDPAAATLARRRTVDHLRDRLLGPSEGR